MSFSGLLPHTLQVYRRAEDGSGNRLTDRFGQELSQNPRQHTVEGETLVATYPCRAYMTAGGLVFEERMIDTFERQFEVFLDFGAEFREDDAVRCVGANGEVIFGLAKIKDSEIKYAYGEPHHIELSVWEQAGPGSVDA